MVAKAKGPQPATANRCRCKAEMEQTYSFEGQVRKQERLVMAVMVAEGKAVMGRTRSAMVVLPWPRHYEIEGKKYIAWEVR